MEEAGRIYCLFSCRAAISFVRSRVTIDDAGRRDCSSRYTAISLSHVFALHGSKAGSSNPLTVCYTADIAPLSHFFSVKDRVCLGLFALLLLLPAVYAAEALGYGHISK